MLITRFNSCRHFAIILMALFVTPLLLQSCGGIPTKYRRANQKTVNDILPTAKYQKKIGIAKIINTSQFSEAFVSESLINALSEGLKKNAPHMNLVSAKDTGAPSFLSDPPPFKKGKFNSGSFLKEARSNGFQSLAVAHIQNINVKDLKKGILWFRKTKRFLHLELRVTLFDGLTGGMLYSEPKVKLISIEPEAAEAFKKDPKTLFPIIKAQISGMGETFAKEMVSPLKKLKWTVTILSKKGTRFILPIGKQAGIRTGDRFEVFSGSRTVENDRGEKFIVPGYKKGELSVESITDHRATAKALNGNSLIPGDIVAPFPFQAKE